MKLALLIAILLVSTMSFAQEPQAVCTGKCFTPAQVEQLRQAADELYDVHESPAILEFQDPIIIIRDWDGRVYVNGGDTIPLRLKLKIGKHVDRDLKTTIKTQVHYREAAPDPMFRLRLRAQAVLLVPEAVRSVSGETDAFIDAGLSWDFFHFSSINLAAFTGVRSVGFGPGLDITKNFGVQAGYSLVYNGFKSSAFVGTYFSFN